MFIFVIVKNLSKFLPHWLRIVDLPHFANERHGRFIVGFYFQNFLVTFQSLKKNSKIYLLKTNIKKLLFITRI